MRNDVVLVGYLLLDKPARDFDRDTARALLAGRLPNGLAPVLVVLPEFPLSLSGKVDRKALPWPLPDAGESAALGHVLAEAEVDRVEADLAQLVVLVITHGDDALPENRIDREAA